MDQYKKNLKIIKCRGVILYEDKLLVVKHSLSSKFYALPGGHLDGDENPNECIKREIFEEFGVNPEVGNLLYINQFSDPDKSFLEFFFEIKNGIDFKNLDENKIDKKEIIEIVWVKKDNGMNILPTKLNEDFKNGILGKNNLQFIKYKS
jgi:ADP-ribose pyrophosphatase YjhB (NUDIX family)